MEEVNPRLSIVVSNYDLKYLKAWAWIHGKSPSAYAGQILAAQIEANQELIERMVEKCAELEGVDAKEIWREILNGRED